MQIRPGRRRRRKEDGAAAIEFALTVPVLLLILAAIVNFGYMFAQQLTLDNAAREVARYAVVDVPGRTCSDLEGRLADKTWLSTTNIAMTISGGPGPCERPCAGGTSTTDVKVELNFTSEPLITLPLPTFNFPGFGPVPLTGEGVFRCEYI